MVIVNKLNNHNVVSWKKEIYCMQFLGYCIYDYFLGKGNSNNFVRVKHNQDCQYANAMQWYLSIY